MKTDCEKKEPAYRTKLKRERADEIYVNILKSLTRGKRYRDPDFTARRLAQELGVTPRSISAAVAQRTGDNYNALVNSYRLRDACRMLRSPRYAHLSVEEIGLLSGFSSRQAFYIAFHRVHDLTPRAYRLQG